MQIKNKSLANMQGKLSRAEMRDILAGTDPRSTSACNVYCQNDSGLCIGACSKCEGGPGLGVGKKICVRP